MAMRRKGQAVDAPAKLSTADLAAGVRTRRRELMDLRFESARSGTAPAGRIRALKAEIARHLTELRRRRS